MKINRFISILFGTLLIPTSYANSDAFEAKVVKIADGDTITVLKDNNEQVKIRLASIDCPEKGQPWGNNATNALRVVIGNQPVTILPQSIDLYGRTIATVTTASTDLNRYMVETGNCWVYSRYATDPELFTLQRAAQAQRLGLWKLHPSEITPPWEWRRK
jgi:endonuclease YncB( thermonuclease family)